MVVIGLPTWERDETPHTSISGWRERSRIVSPAPYPLPPIIATPNLFFISLPTVPKESELLVEARSEILFLEVFTRRGNHHDLSDVATSSLGDRLPDERLSNTLTAEVLVHNEGANLRYFGAIDL